MTTHEQALKTLQGLLAAGWEMTEISAFSSMPTRQKLSITLERPKEESDGNAK